MNDSKKRNAAQMQHYKTNKIKANWSTFAENKLHYFSIQTVL